MARLRELLPAMRTLGPVRFVKNVWREIGEDNLFSLAAALAYSWLFAIFPFLIFLLTLVAYVPEQHLMNAKDSIAEAINRVMSKPAADTILKNLDSVTSRPRTGLLSLGAVLTLWAASGGVAMTMSALDTAYDAAKVRPFYKQRPIAILLTCILTIMVILVFILLPVGTQVMRWLSNHHMLPWFFVWAVNFIRYGMALLLLFCVLATLYRFGTNVPQKFAFLSPGALFTVVVWCVLGYLFRIYVAKIGQLSYEKTYGAVGGVTLILFFFYIDALVMLIGAEINAEVDGAIRKAADDRVAAESSDPPLSLPAVPSADAPAKA
jgi:membrane protein